jgi:hypothetical protein
MLHGFLVKVSLEFGQVLLNLGNFLGIRIFVVHLFAQIIGLVVHIAAQGAGFIEKFIPGGIPLDPFLIGKTAVIPV